MWQVFLKILVIFPHRVTAVTLSLCFNPWVCLGSHLWLSSSWGSHLSKDLNERWTWQAFTSQPGCPLSSVLFLSSFILLFILTLAHGRLHANQNKKPPLRRCRLCRAEGLAESGPRLPRVVCSCAVDTLNVAALFVLAFFLHLCKL